MSRGLLRADLSPLRDSRDFRLLFASRTVTLFGTAASEVALLVQARQLTGSAFAVGLLGVAELVPLVVFGLYGGVLADRLDRRRLLRWGEAGLGLLAVALVVNSTTPHPAVWPLYLLAAAMSALAALQRPSLDASVPRTVARDRLPAASALLSMSANAASITGAALGGAVAAGPGPQWVYGFDAVSFAISGALLLRLRPLPPTAGGEHQPVPGLRAILAGLRYARGRPDLLGSYLADLAAMIFAYPNALFPFLAATLHATWAVGLMFAAPSVGALLVSATSGWTGRVRQARPGHRERSRGLGPGRHRIRAGPGHLGGARLPAGGGRRGHDQRDLPGHAVEPDHSRCAARPAGRGGAAQLRRRAVSRTAAGWRGGQPDHAPHLGRLGRPAVRGRGRRDLPRAARIHPVPRRRPGQPRSSSAASIARWKVG